MDGNRGGMEGIVGRSDMLSTRQKAEVRNFTVRFALLPVSFVVVVDAT